MPQLVASADIYASTRVGIFFTAHNETPLDGNLTGQCVTLNKWFLLQMTDVPNPFAARGDARYVGDRLVAEGHAVEVPYADRKPGDFAVYKYGQYGHIGVILSGDRIFEENVNVGGVARKLVDGAYVYASRIGSLNETWRPVRPTIYRIKSYKEGNEVPITKEMEMSEAYKATGSYPGDNYNYPFVGTTDYDGMLTAWQARMRKITKESERGLADRLASLRSGRTITGYIGDGYNSKFVGQPEVYYQQAMEDFWIKMVAADPNLAPTGAPNAKVLPKGDYRVE